MKTIRLVGVALTVGFLLGCSSSPPAPPVCPTNFGDQYLEIVRHANEEWTAFSDWERSKSSVGEPIVAVKVKPAAYAMVQAAADLKKACWPDDTVRTAVLRVSDQSIELAAYLSNAISLTNKQTGTINQDYNSLKQSLFTYVNRVRVLLGLPSPDGSKPNLY